MISVTSSTVNQAMEVKTPVWLNHGLKVTALTAKEYKKMAVESNTTVL